MLLQQNMMRPIITSGTSASATPRLRKDKTTMTKFLAALVAVLLFATIGVALVALYTHGGLVALLPFAIIGLLYN
jgi:hypothetical protein